MTVTNPKDSVEKYSPNESDKDAHTVLRGAASRNTLSVTDTKFL